MPAKAPIYLKQNSSKNGVTGGRSSKKLREILSTEMISPPLGDFRHMAHVGRGGKDDMFGDTTFLQQKVASSNNANTEKQQGVPNFHSFRRKGPGKGSKKQRNNSVPDEPTAENTPIFKETQNGCGPAQSPILQSAFSLPQNNQENSSTPSTPGHSESKTQETNEKTTVNNNVITTTPEARLNGPTKPRRITDEEKPLTNGHVENVKPNGVITPTSLPNKQKNPGSCISDTTSIDESWSLELDLGTSFLDDVIGIMDKIEL